MFLDIQTFIYQSERNKRKTCGNALVMGSYTGQEHLNTAARQFPLLLLLHTSTTTTSVGPLVSAITVTGLSQPQFLSFSFSNEHLTVQVRFKYNSLIDGIYKLCLIPRNLINNKKHNFCTRTFVCVIVAFNYSTSTIFLSYTMSFIRATGDIIGFLLLSLIAIIEAILKSFIPRRYKMKSVAGEIALVTGGGSGLGRLLSFGLANLGVIVVIWDINEAGMDETVKLIRAAGGTCYGYVCNLCNKEDVYEKAEIIKKEVGQISILVNNAGVVNGKKLMDMSDELMSRTMNVNIMAHFWTAKAFLPSMMEKNEGHIVSVASLAGHVGVPKLTDYCASKSAVIAFNEALRMELAEDGYNNIHTTVICPYFIRSTGMFDAVESRFVSALNSNEVADRIIMAVRCNEQFVILPGYFQGLLAAKWIFPWACFEMFIRGLVQDAGPENERTEKSQNENQQEYGASKDQNGTIHQQLTRRISSSERKP